MLGPIFASPHDGAHSFRKSPYCGPNYTQNFGFQRTENIVTIRQLQRSNGER